MNPIDIWTRRAWRRDAAAIRAFSGMHPALVVTGGSEGIGRAIAREMSAPDRMTVLIARSEDRLRAAATDLAAATGTECLVLPLDLCADDAAERIRAFLVSRDLYCDVLVNCAGIGTTGAFAEDPPGANAAVADLNVTALTRLTHAFLPDMLVRGEGGVINVASLGGFLPGPFQATYYATKAYVISLTRALAWENRGLGVRIVTVAPGPVNTGFHARADGETSLYRRILPAVSSETVARWTRRGFALNQGIITPGVLATLASLFVRILPGALTMPLMAVLLKPRGNGSQREGRQPNA